LVSLFREKLLQDQLRAATQSVQNMQRLHEYGQSQLFDLQAQSGVFLNTFSVKFVVSKQSHCIT
jgi:hypothetical protein